MTYISYSTTTQGQCKNTSEYIDSILVSVTGVFMGKVNRVPHQVV